MARSVPTLQEMCTVDCTVIWLNTDSVPGSERRRIAKSLPTVPARRCKSLNDVSRQRITIADHDHHNLPSPRSSDFNDRKRKREQEDKNSTTHEPNAKHSRLNDTDDTVVDQTSLVAQKKLVDHWVHNNLEYTNFPEEVDALDEMRSLKRIPSNSSSFAQSTQSGDTPKAWGGKHAELMRETGIFMDEQPHATITEEDRILCDRILQAQYKLPTEWSYQNNNFLKILDKALYRNEARVRRDIGPHIMPSPEVHHAQGDLGLEHVAEGVDAQWTKCTSLCGPKSRPDVSHGLSRFVFTPQERIKLNSNNTCACESMILPFYICEAKCFDKSIEESELQALHSASVASNAVIQMYQKISAADELHGRILVFSVSHNQRVVKVFGHYAMIDGDKATFYRHRLFETDLKTDAGNRNKPYQIARGIWEHFYPIHLQRIRHALSRQRDHVEEPFAAQPGIDDDTQSGVTTPSSSQEEGQYKKASRSSTVKLQEENARLLRHVLEQQRQKERQIERLSEQHKEQIERLSEQHKEQMDRQLEQHREQMEQQKVIIALLKQAKA